jgi:DNA polymerase-3 subunit gamma/tau
MSYQALARKWRPRRFSELVGQEHVVRALAHALDSGRLHHAFLFTGTRGVGKTTIARIFAKSLNCEKGPTSNPCGECGACREIDAGRFVDLLEIDAASNTGIDNVRELIDNAQYAPARGRYKVYLIDEVHMLSKSAFNALLKTLEEPPPHVKFLLATTDPQKLPVTVLSRCIKFNLKRLTPEQIEGQMRQILGAEGVAFDEEAIDVLARAADGSLRDGLSLLDQAIAHGGGALRADDVHAMLGTVERARVRVLLDILANGDGAALLEEIDRIASFAPDFGQVLDELAGILHRIQLLQLVPGAAGEDDAALLEEIDRIASFAPDFGQVLDELAGILHRIQLLQLVPGAAGEDDAALLGLAGRVNVEDVQLWYQMAVAGRRDLPLAPSPRVGFEMTLLRMLAFVPAGAESTAASKPSTAAISTKNATRAPAAVAVPPANRPESSAPPHASIPPASSKVEPTDGTAANVASPTTSDWEALIRRAELGGPLGQFARQTTLIAIEGSLVRLALKPAHEHLASAPVVSQMEQKLGTVLGGRVKIRFEREHDHGESPAEQRARSENSRRRAAEDALQSDPVVQSLVDTFGARVVAGSVRPAED